MQNTENYGVIATAFNASTSSRRHDLHFGADGSVTAIGHKTTKDWEAISFWFAVQRVVDTLEQGATASRRRPARMFPTSVYTMHPNVIWDIKARLGLAHIAQFLQRGQRRMIEPVLEDVLGGANLVRGRGISVVDDTNLWLTTVAPRIYTNAHLLLPGQLLTWKGVDIDGSSPNHINYNTIRKVCQLFMVWVLSEYQADLRPFREECGLAGDIHRKLEATKPGLRLWSGGRNNAYTDPGELIDDLRQLRRKLRHEVDKQRVGQLARRVDALGFSLVEFQPRLNAATVWATMSAIARANGSSLPSSENERLAWIRQAHASPEVNLELKPQSRKAFQDDVEIAHWVMDCMRGYVEIHERTGRLSSAVVANARHPADIRAAELLFKWGGLPVIDIIDLKEDPPGLGNTAGVNPFSS